MTERQVFEAESLFRGALATKYLNITAEIKENSSRIIVTEIKLLKVIY